MDPARGGRDDLKKHWTELDSTVTNRLGGFAGDICCDGDIGHSWNANF